MSPEAVSAIAAVAYTVITLWLILENRALRADEKLPCVVIRARMNASRSIPMGVTADEWKLRLINVGSGPAFLESFETSGLPKYADGVHTGDIDSVIGAGDDPDQQIDFCDGEPADLRKAGVRIVIRYRDIARRLFETEMKNGRSEFRRILPLNVYGAYWATLSTWGLICDLLGALTLAFSVTVAPVTEIYGENARMELGGRVVKMATLDARMFYAGVSLLFLGFLLLMADNWRAPRRERADA